MKRNYPVSFLNKFLTLLLITVSSAKSYVYMFTDMGDVFRTSDGVHFNLISNTGYTDAVSLIFVGNNLGYLLTSNGDILRTNNNGESWTPISSISVNDATDLIYGNGYFYVLTGSGDLFRGTAIGSLSLSGSISDNNFVSLAINGGYMFALTASGNVWRSVNGRSWQLAGSTGSTDMVDIDVMNDTLYAVNNYGDIFRSVDSGATWIMAETVSQIGAVDMQVTRDGFMLLCFNTGELMKRTERGWQYTGTVSQTGVLGLSASGVTFVRDTGRGRQGPELTVYPVIAGKVIRIFSDSGEISLYSSDGKIVLNLRKMSGELELNISNLRSGIYFVKYRSGSVKFIKM